MLMGIMGHIEDYDEALDAYDSRAAIPSIPRGPAQVARFFDGLELLPPGGTSCSRRHPDAPAHGLPAEVHR